MSVSTRQQLLDAALRVFARRGFYGASLSMIADELGLTKQALLHHFGTKEKLYGEILSQLSESMLARVRKARLDHGTPTAQLEAFLIEDVGLLGLDPDVMQLLMRELLDNPARAGKVRTWYLRPFLDELVVLAQGLPARGAFDETRAFAFVYSLLGAVHYFLVSQPTLQPMYGRKRYAEIRREMAEELRALVRARVARLADSDSRE